ncbi:hypothetical protein N7499_003509 [Penicillium canescens]|uniref:DUF7587 domain-containing protein n=1 Tax=Penicillium canescens TaxID=5083 RepID=A0AAD6N7D4_PENCN|nr:uncharacterized protein N7446_012425 [Penicillium canescens]KAJ6020209.1 hypothetical protein N7522_000284 [Penicillium canescens]KAJ6038163.1 hypothetical protein N7460_007934 [Penicillium canescens]KAJ6045561.1 hypothetical protein N7446_012425 [Penicillium canescens]KAJ6061245.1 hypothetical protein N7444_001941 [Penicillium canescens]KAJ6090795.1 hypothetical protein N7499_003509 [Penicillium canescens]
MEEWQGESEIIAPIMGMEESLSTMAGLAEEVGRHLLKTQINRGKTTMDGSYYLSRFASLSGDMRWTLHTSFRKHSRQSAGQESGMAIFDTAILMECGAQVFRVSDLLLFLGKQPRYGGSAITELAKVWATNADEYICWDVIPKQALVNFISCDTMTDGLAPERMFLRSEFRETQSLALFKQKDRVLLSPDDYVCRISLFLCDIMREISPTTKGVHLIEHLFATLHDPYPWGYHVAGDKNYMERKLLAVVNAEYSCGIGSWMFSGKFSIDLQHCEDLRKEYLLKAERLLAEFNMH